MLETHPQPDKESIGVYYDTTTYISHSDSNSGWFDTLYQKIKQYALGNKSRLVHRLAGGRGSLLDLGAGTGDFVAYMAQKGWRTQGVELSESARQRSKEKGIHLLAEWEELQGQQFDVVTLWHVLEHLHDLDQSVQKITDFVKPGGLLLIAVPNYNSYDAKFYKKYWAAYDVPRHLWHFSRKTMAQLFSSSFSLIQMRPMWFDSFYVSLISEKYKTGKRFSLKAIWIGFWSNLFGLRTKEYSSIIYCYRKA